MALNGEIKFREIIFQISSKICSTNIWLGTNWRKLRFTSISTQFYVVKFTSERGKDCDLLNLPIAKNKFREIQHVRIVCQSRSINSAKFTVHTQFEPKQSRKFVLRWQIYASENVRAIDMFVPWSICLATILSSAE